jgi:hypothetical protein
MEKTFTILGQAYGMLEPTTMGADVRIQQTRKAYFTRLRRREKIEAVCAANGVMPVIDGNSCLDEAASIRALYDAGQGEDSPVHRAAEQLEDRLAQPEPRMTIRENYEDWLKSIEDTSLEGILTVCAVLKPMGGSTPLVPEALLNSPPWDLGNEIVEASGFFWDARHQSEIAYRLSKAPLPTTTEATIPTETSST